MKQNTLNNVLSVLFVIFVVSLIFLLDLLIFISQVGLDIDSDEFHNRVFNYYSSKFQSDPIILEISESCIGNARVKCVFDKIPMEWDYDRLNGKGTFPPVRTATQYFELGGVCRDVTLIRHSALKNLGIDCSFNFTEFEHVFLNCEYNGNFYELNNGNFYIN